MNTTYHTLYYLENSKIALIEIKIDTIETNNLDKIFYWFLYDKTEDTLQRLDFQSSHLHNNYEERHFEQGYLRFTNEVGQYTADTETEVSKLVNNQRLFLPENIISYINKYLKEH
ncbi:hypothetical protein [Flavobacterium kingsejongi]|uniref:Uncharacterized protein n=1 Tax=Flavobacterium kingsejongi TaxID=1678728 RepID=A0A2S1LRU9_9FLAO|nr:hypothetical protein [Flavobacterium kingsejongi]AWG26366.1 hypothetical protein FK004_14585 [Flavobacterium kingsejongi]